MDEIQDQVPAETQFPEHNPQFMVPEQPPKSGISRKRLVLVIVGIIVLGAAGFVAALLTSKDTPPASSTNETTNHEPRADSSSVTTDISAVTATKTFKSDFPRIEFTYPENWKITESREQEGVRIESPEFNYQSINGNTIKGNFRVYIRQGARPQDSKYIGRGLAAQPSEKLTYTSPSSNQRPETNLSFFGLDSSDNFAFFMIAGNFALQKDESLGPEYGTEPETYIIAGGYSSNELADDLATNPVPVDYFSTTNAYKQALDILKSLKIL